MPFGFGSKSSAGSKSSGSGGPDDDLYSGFDTFSSNLDPSNQASHLGRGIGSNPLGPITGALAAGASKVAKPYVPPPTGRVGGITGRMPTSQQRLMTSQGTVGDQRPMTSVKGAGFRSNGKASKDFDPLNQNRGPAPPLAEKGDDSAEERAKGMERKVHKLVDRSAIAAAAKDYTAARDLAKEAARKERQLCKFREGNGLVEQINFDLTYSVCFNLAVCYTRCKMYSEAVKAYMLIVKNKQYPQAGRLRVNIGNIYYTQKKYMNAIKMYRMALDQIPNTAKELKYKIHRNIGNAFVRLGQFHEAIQSYETIVEEAKPESTGFPDFRTPFNLIVCYYAIGASDKMRRGFSRLIGVPQPTSYDDDDDDRMPDAGESKAGVESKTGMGGMESKASAAGSPKSGSAAEEKTAAVGAHQERDTLREEVVRRQKRAKSFILTSAKLIAPYIDQREWTAGFDWLIDQLQPEYAQLASEVEIAKAITYLRKKQFDRAIEVFKSFEKKDHALQAKAATNLSFLYFIEGEYELADKYANLAVRHDRYNAKALVNKGNCLFAHNELEKAKELYLESIGVEADCIEAIYNLGIANKRLGILEDSLQAFQKLHTIVPSSPEVIYQIANLHDLTGNYRAACKWFSILLTATPTDPGILSRLGQTYTKDDDESQAFHYHTESYRHYPVNLEVISWLGVWYVKSEMYERAIHYFERAAEIQPREVKWRLMVTSCFRRLGSLQKALELYEQIHREYPQNLECLRYLVAICKQTSMPHEKYEVQLRKLERAAAQATGAGLAGGILTQMNGPSGGGNPVPKTQAGMDQRSGGGGRPQVERMAPIKDVAESPDNGRIGAPGMAGQLQTRAVNQRPKGQDDVDDFSDADIDDLWAD